MVVWMLAITFYVVPARPMTPPMILSALAVDAGWPRKEVDCAIEIVWRESRWNPESKNPKSSAYGLFQILGTKPSTKIVSQIQAGIRYIKTRYHNSPCLALAHHKRHGWY